MEAEKRYLSIAETCIESGLSRATVYRLIASGDLHSVKIGARRIVPTAALTELMAHGLAKVAS